MGEAGRCSLFRGVKLVDGCTAVAVARSTVKNLKGRVGVSANEGSGLGPEHAINGAEYFQRT